MEQNKGKHQEKPFPFNIRNWLPNIDQNEIKSKLKNPNKLIRVINYNLFFFHLLLHHFHNNSFFCWNYIYLYYYFYLIDQIFVSFSGFNINLFNPDKSLYFNGVPF